MFGYLSFLFGEPAALNIIWKREESEQRTLNFLKKRLINLTSALQVFECVDHWIYRRIGGAYSVSFPVLKAVRNPDTQQVVR